jgi:hypothetical protein
MLLRSSTVAVQKLGCMTQIGYEVQLVGSLSVSGFKPENIKIAALAPHDAQHCAQTQ